MKEDDKEQLRSSLDELIDLDLPDEVDDLSEEHDLPMSNKLQSSSSVGLSKAKNKASRVMNSLLKFYLSEEIIEEHEYIKAKKAIDETALTMLIRQMKNSEDAITVLMDNITLEGDISPRMFEVLSDLQRTLLDIIKSQTMYMVAIEENAKKISRDIDIYHQNNNSKKENTREGLKSRGTKNIMRALQESMKEENIEDVDSSEDEK